MKVKLHSLPLIKQRLADGNHFGGTPFVIALPNGAPPARP